MPTYLQNSHTPGLATAVCAWLATPCAPCFQPWALADLSILDTGALRQLERLASPTIPLLAGTRYAAYEELGPRLIPLSTDSVPAVEGILRVADPLPAMSFVELSTSEGVPDRRGLVALASAETPDGMQLYCRFTDTRVLPKLLHVLDQIQHAWLATTVRRWSWIGRDGALETRAFARIPGAETDTPPAIELSDAQFASLMQSAEPDTLYQLAREISPEIIPTLPPAAIHARLESLLKVARGYGITETPDQLQFVAIAWSSSDRFHELESLHPSWAATRSGELRFGDAVKGWTDAQWNEIEAMTNPSAEVPVGTKNINTSI